MRRQRRNQQHVKSHLTAASAAAAAAAAADDDDDDDAVAGILLRVGWFRVLDASLSPLIGSTVYTASIVCRALFCPLVTCTGGSRPGLGSTQPFNVRRRLKPKLRLLGFVVDFVLTHTVQRIHNMSSK